jgi:hypothetical protein
VGIMVCPICKRIYCDHSPQERGQTQQEMIEDMTSPHIIDGGETRKVTSAEYEEYTGQKWGGSSIGNKKEYLHELFSSKVREIVQSAKKSSRYTSKEVGKLENYRTYILGMVESGMLADESYDLLTQASAQDIAQYAIYGGELEKIIERMKKFNNVVDAKVPARDSVMEEKPAMIDIYHRARVISLYPQSGKRLSKATVRNRDFPLRSDQIMDDNVGLRCCYHPKLTTFGIRAIDDWDEIEIDIHKYPKDNIDGDKNG